MASTSTECAPRPRVSPATLRRMLARASRTERPLYPMAGWDAPAASPSRPSPPTARFNNWGARRAASVPEPRQKPRQKPPRRMDCRDAKARLREWLTQHMKTGPAKWPLFRAADIAETVPVDLRVPLAPMLSVIALELNRAGLVCHEPSNLANDSDCRRLWSPRRHAARLSKLTAGGRATLYRAQCTDRLRSPVPSGRRTGWRNRYANCACRDQLAMRS
jgi:hypothetical protein